MGHIHNHERFPISDHAELQLIVGGLEIGVAEHNTHFRDDSNAALALVKKDKILEHAHIDGLTGLSNKAAFDIDFPRYFERASQNESETNTDGTPKQLETHRRPLVLAVVDIDNLNGINKSYGRVDGGNPVLKSLADSIQRHLRPGDQAYRIGGDEFYIVMSNIDVNGDDDEMTFVETRSQDLEWVFESDIAETADRLLPRDGQQHAIHVGATVSLTVLHPGESAEEFLSRADHASLVEKDRKKSKLSDDGLGYGR